jgi:hypothetical protein
VIAGENGNHNLAGGSERYSLIGRPVSGVKNETGSFCRIHMSGMNVTHEREFPGAGPGYACDQNSDHNVDNDVVFLLCEFWNVSPDQSDYLS